MGRILVLAVLALVAVVGIALLPSTKDDREAQPTYAQRVAHNYRTLTKAESHMLVAYAASVYRCVSAQHAGVSPPVASSTRITMRAPNSSARTLVRVLAACDSTVGPPPPRSSLQARRAQILVYVPKQCLLDPSERSTS